MTLGDQAPPFTKVFGLFLTILQSGGRLSLIATTVARAGTDPDDRRRRRPSAGGRVQRRGQRTDSRVQGQVQRARKTEQRPADNDAMRFELSFSELREEAQEGGE
jgi:hypothetical protein